MRECESVDCANHRLSHIPLSQNAVYFQSDQLSLLFQWCRLLCTRHGIPVHNFTSSFADGRALCVLIGHYHPEILPLSQIHHPRAIAAEVADENGAPGENLSGDPHGWTMTFSPGRKRNEPLINRNFQLFHKAIREIGGIPVLRMWEDGRNKRKN